MSRDVRKSKHYSPESDFTDQNFKGNLAEGEFSYCYNCLLILFCYNSLFSYNLSMDKSVASHFVACVWYLRCYLSFFLKMFFSDKEQTFSYLPTLCKFQRIHFFIFFKLNHQKVFSFQFLPF